jgi:hypothetical protein
MRMIRVDLWMFWVRMMMSKRRRRKNRMRLKMKIVGKILH